MDSVALGFRAWGLGVNMGSVGLELVFRALGLGVEYG